MARLPFFETTWKRKARLTGIVLGVFLAARLLALLSERLIGLGWGDLPVSLLAIVYLAFLYVEIWIILERHTRPFLSVVAAALLAALCLASPLIPFDPVATGSVPDRLRFWEPSPGLERPAGQKITLLSRSFLQEPLVEAEEALTRAEGELFPVVGLLPGSAFLPPAERTALEGQLLALVQQRDLPPTRSHLWAQVVLVQLARARLEQTLVTIQRRVDCLQAGAAAPAAPAGVIAPAPCLADPAWSLPLAPSLVDPEALQEQGATVTFIDRTVTGLQARLAAATAAEQPASGAEGLPRFRVGPQDDPARPFASLLAGDAGTNPPDRALPPDLSARLERHESALRRYLRSMEDTRTLEAQIALIPTALANGLAARRLPEGEVAEWQLQEQPELARRFEELSVQDLQRMLDPRPREVLRHTEQIADPQQQELFLHFLAQTNHWHLRDPARVKARLQQAEDEFRAAEVIGGGQYPPVQLCQMLQDQGSDAAVLQLASLDRGGNRHLRLLLVHATPCLTVWDHDVPIYDQSDVLGSTVDDAAALSVAATEFFAPSLLGTDYLGKDLLMQLVKGTEGFFLPGLLAVAIGLGLGVILGAFAGYMGGRVDKAITFFTTLIGSFPRLVFILLVCTIPETPSMLLIGGITGALFIPQVAEAVRRRVLALKAEDFIVASRAHGLSLPRILFYHMVWLQCFPEIVRQALYLFVYVIFLETALSYLEGPGAPPEIPSWGRMLANATAAMFHGQYWHALVPTAAIVFTTIGVAALGDVIVGQAKEERL
ncbi:MAG: ABC transporter permease [Myxococcota bacterium]|jgi:peptide/nickel transport system permease protein|nr:ABC transporter permease [Myxococcota bacterium]